MTAFIEANLHLGITAFSILIFLLIWEHVWKKSALDRCRDQLFDLRDGARDWFLQKGLSLDDEVYHCLRDLLNSHLRNTEKLSFTRFFIASYYLNHDDEYKKSILEYLDDSLRTEDKEVQNYAKKVRREASEVVAEYMFKSNLFMVSLSLLMAPIIIIKTATKSIYGIFRDGKRLLQQNIQRTAILTTVVALVFSILPWQIIPNTPRFGKYVSQQKIEKYSVRC